MAEIEIILLDNILSFLQHYSDDVVIGIGYLC